MPSVAPPVSAVNAAAADAAKRLVADDSKLTFEEKFAQVVWTDRDSMVRLFPDYVQEQYALRKARAKNVTAVVNIEPFTMKTPYGDRVLLQNTKLIIEPNKRLGLIGANCTGKTLLFLNLTHGRIKDFPKHLHVHHCRELENSELNDTVINTVLHCFPYLNALNRCEAKLRELMAAEPKPAADVQESYAANLEYVVSQITSLKGYEARQRAEKMLRVLGFDEFGQSKLCSALSGGLRMRVALCIAFFIEPQILLLDDPSSHLDFPSVLWLENRLRGYKGSFLLVSQDRELLNNVCTSVMLIEDKQIKYYAMGFKEFEVKKALEDKKRYEETEKFLVRNRNADPSTPLGREKHDKKEWSDMYHARQLAMAQKFTFPPSTPLETDAVDAEGKALAQADIPLIQLKNVRFSYNVASGVFIFNDPISFTVTAGTRIGIMGPNGAGKSTLLKLLTKRLVPTDGVVEQHPAFTLAYFGQHSTAELNLEQTPIEFMQAQFPKEGPGTLRNHLAKTGVIGLVADTRMQGLSYSQRSCVVFAKLTFAAPHLIILDEPTNFLDLDSVDSLISACQKYQGALLLVSHNRDFLRKCAKGYLSVVPGRFMLYDNMKTAENATYTFIAEMEEGGKVSKDALSKNPGGGSVHSSQKIDGEEKKADAPAGPKVLSISSMPAAAATTAQRPAAPAAPAAAAAAAAPAKTAESKAEARAEVGFAVGDKVEALWTDGKFYPAQIKKIDGDQYTVLYTQYGNTAPVPLASIRKLEAAPRKAGGAKGGKAGGKPKSAGGKAQGQKKPKEGGAKGKPQGAKPAAAPKA